MPENIEDGLSEHIAGYGLTLNESRKWWQPQFEVLALVHVATPAGIHMGNREDHVQWFWTFKQGKKALDTMHAKLVTEAMQRAWWGTQVRHPDAPPQGFGDVL